VTHSAGTYVVDPDGRLRFLYPYGTPSDVLIGAVDGLVGGS
jgi:cytochrome oxidase Cu insertion factor (SCO1/SenC/PrrC family)